ncbi:MAG: hypothetical protein IPI67_10215 [Myxococcales bacterium]|nr:hypothetical protein [Myxococcales bacterium]
MKRARQLWLAVQVVGLSFVVLGCTSAPEDDERTGSLVGGLGPLPGAIRGMHYETAGHVGTTDAEGRFRYRTGQSVRFSVGALGFQPVTGAARVSPFQLANGQSCDVGAPLLRVLQAVFSLDEDDDLDNGVSLPDVPKAENLTVVGELDEPALEASLQVLRPSAKLMDSALALERFIRQVNDEAWEGENSPTFFFPDSVYRGQGTATDGKRWFFSSANHLQRTNSAFEAEVDNFAPIPTDIFKLGGKHIGDIDVHEGLLYASIEDKPDFLHPFVVTYDLETLEPTGPGRLLPEELQLQGVPWVCVDGPRQRLYSADWDPTDHINVYDLANLALVKALPLEPPIGRIQGAKVFRGQLYAASDNDDKSIYKIDLDTGIVMKLLGLDTPKSEAEGLALTEDADGAHLHVLNVVIPNVDFVTFLRTRAPLRDDVCP